MSINKDKKENTHMNIKSMILADNQNQNMKSNTDKVLHNMLGKTLIEYCIDATKGAGINQICVISTGQYEAIKDAIGHQVQSVFQGGEMEIQEAIAFIGDCQDILVINGDAPLITDKTIQQAIKHHRESNHAATIVSNILEESQACSDSLYLFKAEPLKSVLLKMGEGYNLIQIVERLIQEGYQVESMATDCERDLLRVRSRKQLAKCTDIMKNRINEKHMESGVTIQDPSNTYIEIGVSIGYDTVIEPNCMLRGDTVIGANCLIGHNSNIDQAQIADNVKIENSQIHESIIGEHTHIGPFAYIRPNSTVGKHVRIGNFVEIKNATIGDYTKASHLTYVGDADVGKAVNFGCGSILVNYDGVQKYRSTIEDDAFIGCNTKIISPVNIGNRAYTAAGSTITHDVPEESLGVARTRQENKEGWVAHKFPKK